MENDRELCECPKCGRQHRLLSKAPPPAAIRGDPWGALRQCLTVAPSCMTGEEAQERLRNINQHVYRALEVS